MTNITKPVSISLSLGDDLIFPMQDEFNIPIRATLNEEGKVTVSIDPKEIMDALATKLRSWADEIDAEAKEA